MKKTYKIDVDCANCANKMEDAANKVDGIVTATVNFMLLKMIVEFEDGTKGKIYNDTVDNVRGGGKVQILELNNGKKYKIENDFIQNSSVCGGGYQKVISEYDDGYELFSSLIDDLRAHFKIFDIIWRIFSIIVVTAIILLILWIIIMFI